MKRARFAGVCLAFVIVLVQLAWAQTVFGVIRGAVADSSGLPVAGTKVTIRNQNSREARSVTSDDSGDFVFPALIPGQYTATVEAKGFKKYETTGIVLSAEERLDIGRLVLEVGQLTESVVVTAPPTPLQTANAERSTVVNGEQVAELPILSRNVSLYMRLIPGAVEQSGNGTDSYAWQVDPTSPMPHVGGVNAQFNSLSLDGISMLEDGTSGWPNGHINPDALAEVKVLVNNYSAEHGR